MEKFNFELAELQMQHGYLKLEDINLDTVLYAGPGVLTYLTIGQYLKAIAKGEADDVTAEAVRDSLIGMGLSLDLAEKLTFIDTEEEE